MKMDLAHFFITFFSCFLAVLVCAGGVWKLRQKFDQHRRRQRLFKEMEKRASRPFATIPVDVDNHIYYELLMQRYMTIGCDDNDKVNLDNANFEATLPVSSNNGKKIISKNAVGINSRSNISNNKKKKKKKKSSLQNNKSNNLNNETNQLSESESIVMTHYSIKPRAFIMKTSGYSTTTSILPSSWFNSHIYPISLEPLALGTTYLQTNTINPPSISATTYHSAASSFSNTPGSGVNSSSNRSRGRSQVTLITPIGSAGSILAGQPSSPVDRVTVTPNNTSTPLGRYQRNENDRHGRFRRLHLDQRRTRRREEIDNNNSSLFRRLFIRNGFGRQNAHNDGSRQNSSAVLVSSSNEDVNSNVRYSHYNGPVSKVAVATLLMRLPCGGKRQFTPFGTNGIAMASALVCSVPSQCYNYRDSPQKQFSSAASTTHSTSVNVYTQTPQNHSINNDDTHSSANHSTLFNLTPCSSTNSTTQLISSSTSNSVNHRRSAKKPNSSAAFCSAGAKLMEESTSSSFRLELEQNIPSLNHAGTFSSSPSINPTTSTLLSTPLPSLKCVIQRSMHPVILDANAARPILPSSSASSYTSPPIPIAPSDNALIISAEDYTNHNCFRTSINVSNNNGGNTERKYLSNQNTTSSPLTHRANGNTVITSDEVVEANAQSPSLSHSHHMTAISLIPVSSCIPRDGNTPVSISHSPIDVSKMRAVKPESVLDSVNHKSSSSSIETVPHMSPVSSIVSIPPVDVAITGLGCEE